MILRRSSRTCWREGGYDEVVFAAHSPGCALKIAVVDRALQLVPDFGKNGERLVLLSTGSLDFEDRLSSEGLVDERGGRPGLGESGDLLGRVSVDGRPDQLL